MPTLNIKCESNTDSLSTTTTIDFPGERLTVEEIIRGYVYQKVKEAAAKNAGRTAPSPMSCFADRRFLAATFFGTTATV